jgi:hypothetical protein
MKLYSKFRVVYLKIYVVYKHKVVSLNYGVDAHSLNVQSTILWYLLVYILKVALWKMQEIFHSNISKYKVHKILVIIKVCYSLRKLLF